MPKDTDENKRRGGEELSGNDEKKVRTADSSKNEITSSSIWKSHSDIVDTVKITNTNYVG